MLGLGSIPISFAPPRLAEKNKLLYRHPHVYSAPPRAHEHFVHGAERFVDHDIKGAGSDAQCADAACPHPGQPLGLTLRGQRRLLPAQRARQRAKIQLSVRGDHGQDGAVAGAGRQNDEGLVQRRGRYPEMVGDPLSIALGRRVVRYLMRHSVLLQTPDGKCLILRSLQRRLRSVFGLELTTAQQLQRSAAASVGGTTQSRMIQWSPCRHRAKRRAATEDGMAGDVEEVPGLAPDADLERSAERGRRDASVITHSGGGSSHRTAFRADVVAV